MGALASGDWEAYRDGKRLSPFNDLKVGPHSIDVSLADIFIEPRPTMAKRLQMSVNDEDPPILDPYIEKQNEIAWETTKTPYFDLHPGDFVLACVRERFVTRKPVAFSTEMIRVPGDVGAYRTLTNKFHVTQCYDGRSTMGRLGIMSHVTAGYGDLGFASNFTLELHNVNPKITVRLHAGMRIGQISFHAVGCVADEPLMYSGSYTEQHDTPVIPALGWQRFVQPGEKPFRSPVVVTEP